jgi:hypothetical protein
MAMKAPWPKLSGFRDPLWVLRGQCLISGALYPSQVRTNAQTYRETNPGSSTRISFQFMSQRVSCLEFDAILPQMLADKAVQQLVRDRLRGAAAAALASDEFASAKVPTSLVPPPLSSRDMRFGA